ncbi:MAG TPA: tetratricopeptide repeat protein [Bacteroidaceae bacterium]|nr:tetratricopeptide repeat protein [Bacteroidaceae bacterium]
MVSKYNIISWIKHPDKLNRETLYELRSLVAKYPYFQSARVLLVENLYLLNDEGFSTELSQAAFYVADWRVLNNLVESGDSKYAGNTETTSSDSLLSENIDVEDKIGSDRTLTLIEAFLKEKPEDSTLFEYEGANSDNLTDYTIENSLSNIEQNNIEDIEKETSQQDKLIELFIKKGPSSLNKLLDTELPNKEHEIFDDMPDESVDECLDKEESISSEFFTETLANVYIKKKQYDKALEIIRLLYLKFPNKNVYFADQIRYLEKLLLIN